MYQQKILFDQLVKDIIWENSRYLSWNADFSLGRGYISLFTICIKGLIKNSYSIIILFDVR
jgi:hypothetical protein